MLFRSRCLRALAVVALAALVAGWGAPALAQSAPPDQSTTPTTTNGLEDLVNKLLGGGTTTPTAPGTPPAAPDPAPTAPDSGAAPGAPQAPADGPSVPAIPTVIPPDIQAIIDSIGRTPGRNTSELLAALRQLVDIGLSAQEATVIGMGHFPVAGEATYGDDFLMARFSESGVRTHQGNDIQAAEGTPIRASEEGTVTYAEDGGCGKGYTLTTATGYYLGCHLVGFADLGSGVHVTQGQIVGFVGTTGASTGPHLHFEIHPGGGAAVNPKPILDGWLDEARANVPKIVASYQQVGLPKPISYAGSLRRFDEPAADASSPATLVTATPSTAGIRRLTELRAARAHTSDSLKVDTATVDAWRAADQWSRSLLAAVTPGALEAALVGKSN